MMYAIIYVYRLSDFLSVAKAHGVARVFLTSVFVKEIHSENPQGLSDGIFKWTDVHELSFMGAFGMGYKMLVNGKTQGCKVAHNELLWTNLGLLEMHLRAKGVRGGKDCPKELIVTAGTVVGTEIYGQARIPWALFMDDKIPREVPVFDLSR